MSEGVDTHILRHYEIQKRLGKGAYGIVWKATDKRSKDVVALKKIFDAFRNQTDAQRTYREIVFLREFGEHPNVIRLQDVLRADNDRDIYLVFEFMEADLHNVIRKGNILKDTHKRYVMYQLLKAMKYLHSANVIHRDMKPSNVLINQQCRVKICDFGLARSLHHVQEDLQHSAPALTEYVATRWYRAPEILLASSKYTKGVDMWSIGCILGEILLGKPLFQGTSTFNQLERILQHLPTPSESDVASMSSQYGPSVLERAGTGPKKSLENLMPHIPDESLDLLRRLLHFNPDKRITAADALRHSFVAAFHNPKEEMSKGYDVVPQLSDDIQLTVDQYRKKLYEFIKLGEVSAPMPITTSSNSTQQTNASSTKPRDPSAEQPTRHGASAYADQSDYDAHRKPPATKQYEPSRDVYPSQTQATVHETAKYRPNYAQETDDDDYPTAATNDYAPAQPQYNSRTGVYGGQLGRSNTYHGAQMRVSSAKQRNPPQGAYVPYLKTNSGNLTREKAASMNRGTRSGSAPTPTPPPAKPTVNGSNFSYNRRSTAISNDERLAASEKNSGAQAKVNQKFMSSLRPTSAVDARAKARLQSTSTTTQPFHQGASSSAFGSYTSQSQRRSNVGHYSNMTSTMMARDNLGGYNQTMGTLSQNGLRVLDGLLHNTAS